jgi:hypothetical protein
MEGFGRNCFGRFEIDQGKVGILANLDAAFIAKVKSMRDIGAR